MSTKKYNLNIYQILAMNFGFFGIQFSFALQQTNMSPIFRYLGANGENAIFWLAGPMTGLLIQPIIGAMSDNTWGKFGRRKPYFLFGAIIASLALIVMPFSSTVWMAAAVLWILDAGNNIALEPYRAFVGDKLPKKQFNLGFLTQSFLTGLGSSLANFTPAIVISLGLVGLNDVRENGIPETVYWAFFIGAIASIITIAITHFTTQEIPPTEAEFKAMEERKKVGTIQLIINELKEAFATMPKVMKLLIPVKFFTWYAMFCYWQSLADGLALSLFNTSDTSTQLYKEANVLAGQVNGSYNIVCFLIAFALVPIAQKLGASKTHFVSLLVGGLALFFIPQYSHTVELFHIPNIFGEGSIAISQVYLISLGLGIAWASMLSMPYTMLTSSVPSNKMGIYMGIFNMFIVIPMLIQTLTMDFILKHFLNGDKVLELQFAGVFLILGGIASLMIKEKYSNPETTE